MKKFLALLLTAAMMLCLLAGCGGDKDVDTPDDGTVRLTIGLPSNANTLSYTDNALTKWLEEKTGYKLEFIEYSGGTDVPTQIATTVAANKKLPDIIYGVTLTDDAIASYGEDRYFADLTDYYEDRDGASKVFWDRIEECLTEDQQRYVVNKITDAANGRIYAVPTIEVSLLDEMDYQPWINVKWLDKLNLKKPTNCDELYEVLRAFAKNDCNGNGDPNDEIPLFGTEKATAGGHVIDWLLNMFIYYDPDHTWQPNASGDMEYVYTQEAYRTALKYINKLYSEGLLTNMVYTCGNKEAKNITTPNDGVAKVGIFCGHLTIHTAAGSELLYEYEPLQNWGYSIKRDNNVSANVFISADCKYIDEAFNLLMLMFSEEGSMRIRYGEYGVNWTDADEGAKSEMGYDADYKLIDDPLGRQGTQIWGTLASCLNYMAEGETAQASEDMSQWQKTKGKMHAESRALFEATAAANNPKVIAPQLFATTEETEKIEMQRTNIRTYVSNQETAFVTGVGGDINDDKQWSDYLKKLDELGLSAYHDYVQTMYDRQTGK